MHTSAAQLAVAARLPELGPEHYFNQMQSGRNTIVENLYNPTLNAADRMVLKAILLQFSLLESRWDRVVELCGQVPRTLVHGDLCTKNVRFQRTESGLSLLPFDWEAAGCGVPAVDLAQFTMDSLSPDMTTYCSVIRQSWPHLSVSRVRALAKYGVIFRLIDAIYWGRYGIEYDRWLDHDDVREIAQWSISDLRVFKDLMTKAIEAVEWEK
jgi:thiamine kinase-like enzyme